MKHVGIGIVGCSNIRNIYFQRCKGLGVRADVGPFRAYGFNACDWYVDLADKVY